METQKLAFEVYFRKGRLLLALSAVKRALAIGGKADPTAHVLVVRFALAAQQPQEAELPVQASLLFISHPERYLQPFKSSLVGHEALSSMCVAGMTAFDGDAALYTCAWRHILAVSAAPDPAFSACAQASQKVVQEVLSAQTAAILGDASLADYQAAFRKQHATSSLPHLAAAAEAAALLNPSETVAAARSIVEGVHT